ncbi:hypothetical protein A2U01_0086171, partial [Trifolium medium]|nr:hypothetical protein [Trifolium medium]
KRMREDGSPVVEARATGHPFPLPRCFTARGFFDMHPPKVPVAERVVILNQEPDMRRTQQIRDLVGVMRMMETVLVLGEERDKVNG